MAVLIGELYDALVAAGCPPDTARAAAEAVYRDCSGRARAAAWWSHLWELVGSLMVAWLLYAVWAQWAR